MSNEIGSEVDVSTADLMTKNAQAFLDEVDYLLSQVDGPNMLMMNGKMLTKFRGIARRAGYYERTKDDAGRVIETYNGVPIVNLGKYFNGTTAVDAVADTAATASALGKSDIYAVSLGLDGFHGISPTGTGVVQSYMPDMAQPGAVKTGEVELVAGVVLKNTLKAGVLKGIGTAPKQG